MADISNEIEAFQSAKYGEEVRSSLVSAINKINTEVENAVENQIIQLDSTLTQSGYGADAKKTGDEISDLKSQVTTATNLASTAKSAADSKAYISLNNDDTLLVNYAELQAVDVPTTDYTGLLSNLETTVKTDLVSAINEAASSGGESAEIYVEGTKLVINTNLVNGNEVSF